MNTHTIIILAVAAALACHVVVATTYYVDAARPDDSGNGLSWATAKQTIQAAVHLAAAGDTVLVTNGVYASGGARTPGASLSNRVQVTKRVTVRSVNGPEVTEIVGAGPTGVWAVRCVYLASNACLMGFTLRRGCTYGAADYDDQCGGGAFLGAGCVLSNCVVTNNYANYMGGGVMCNFGGMVINCSIIGNRAYDSGGGAACYRGGVLRDCVVAHNLCDYDGGGISTTEGGIISNCVVQYNKCRWDGGGINFYYGGTAQCCVIAGNCAMTSYSGGGGVYFNGTNNVVCQSIIADNTSSNLAGGVRFYEGGRLEECVLINNYGHYGAGGAYAGYGSVLLRCTFISNRVAAGRSPGALSVYSNSTVQDCVFYRHQGERGGAVVVNDDSVIERCVFIENTANSYGGAVECGGHLVDCTFVSNSAFHSGGAVYFTWQDGTATRCSFSYNTVAQGGGAVYCNYGGRLRECVFNQNRANFNGGALYFNFAGLAQQCVFSNNQADLGGAVYCNVAGQIRSSLVYTNRASAGGGVYCNRGGVVESSTIVGNIGLSSCGGVVFNAGGAATNCIVLLNSGGDWLGTGVTNCGYCCTAPLPPGAGNISVDPLFAAPAAGYFHLLESSPCINSGTNLPWMAGATDLDGNPRVYDGRVDMGCYEFVPEPRVGTLLIGMMGLAVYEVRLAAWRGRKATTCVAK